MQLINQDLHCHILLGGFVAAYSDGALSSSVYGVNGDSKLRYCFRYLYFHGNPYFHVSDGFDAVSELLDKQLFSDSKSE